MELQKSYITYEPKKKKIERICVGATKYCKKMPTNFENITDIYICNNNIVNLKKNKNDGKKPIKKLCEPIHFITNLQKLKTTKISLRKNDRK